MHLYIIGHRKLYYLYPRNELPPHIYSTSSRVLQNVKKSIQLGQFKDQTVLISGESGSGKTETVKILMNHIASICGDSCNGLDNPTVQKVIIEIFTFHLNSCESCLICRYSEPILYWNHLGMPKRDQMKIRHGSVSF